MLVIGEPQLTSSFTFLCKWRRWWQQLNHDDWWWWFYQPWLRGWVWHFFVNGDDGDVQRWFCKPWLRGCLVESLSQPRELPLLWHPLQKPRRRWRRQWRWRWWRWQRWRWRRRRWRCGRDDPVVEAEKDRQPTPPNTPLSCCLHLIRIKNILILIILIRIIRPIRQ